MFLGGLKGKLRVQIMLNIRKNNIIVWERDGANDETKIKSHKKTYLWMCWVWERENDVVVVCVGFRVEIVLERGQTTLKKKRENTAFQKSFEIYFLYYSESF